MGPIQGAKIEVERCLSSLSSINKTAAELYLEFAVFTRKDTVCFICQEAIFIISDLFVDCQASTLHEQLINQYLDRLSHLFASTDLKSEIDVARQEYATTVNTSEVTIVSFTLSKARQSESMNTRAKLILLLHGSVVYDALAVQTRLDSLPGLLFEQALVAGRLSQHEQVLTILANKLQDLASAEAYCTHAGNGDILSARNVRELLQFLQLSPYPSALYRKDGRRKASKQTNTPLTPAQKEEKRKNLLNKLIKIQLEQCSPLTASLLDQQRTAHVIETQAIRISAKDILNSIPDDWPLPLMQNFLIRSLRRSLHTRYEKKLVKAVLQSQTLDSSLRYWAATERLGGVLAEEADDEPEANTQGEKSSAPSSDDVVYLEKGPLSYADDEKTVEVD